MSARHDLSTAIPQELAELIGQVSINGLSVCFDLPSMTLASPELEVTATGHWPLIPDLLTLEDVQLWFVLAPHAGSDHRLHGGLTAHGKISADIELTASATFPDPILRLTAHNPESLRYREVTEIGPLHLEDGSVHLRDLRAEYGFRSKEFSAE
ncbi:hypothetical protein [Streptomyces olivoreticuli]|uniref:hypothetical protein n=1 Tax=Streptomyces olivoreticuli TaxID=68246 RepID=UPI0013C2C1E5|nr:hypothetical protein [Streptomyces olivoreticuli]